VGRGLAAPTPTLLLCSLRPSKFDPLGFAQNLFPRFFDLLATALTNEP